MHGLLFLLGQKDLKWLLSINYNEYTANILTVLSTAFGSVTFPTVIWLHILQPNIAISLKLYSSKSVTVMCTTNGCTKYSVWQCYVYHCNLAVNICSVFIPKSNCNSCSLFETRRFEMRLFQKLSFPC